MHDTWQKTLASSLLAAATSARCSGARVRDETISRRAADGGPATDAIAAIRPTAAPTARELSMGSPVGERGWASRRKLRGLSKRRWLST